MKGAVMKEGYVPVDYDKLKERLKEKDLTLADAAKRIGMNPSTISSMIRRDKGIRKVIARALEAEFNILPDEYEPDERPVPEPVEEKELSIGDDIKVIMIDVVKALNRVRDFEKTLKILMKETHSMNNVTLIGRLTADPVIRSTTTGKMTASFTLAVDRRVKKDEQNADFIRCICWEKKAAFAEQYLHKGTKIAISGRIQTGSYKDKDGKTVYTTDVVVEEIEFAESKQQTTDGFVSIPDGVDEELPFN